MSTPSRRKRVVRDGSAPKRRSATPSPEVIAKATAEVERRCVDLAEKVGVLCRPSRPGDMYAVGRFIPHPGPRTLPKEVTEAADRLSLLRALRTASRTMLTTTAQDWVRMGLPESEVAEVMEGLAQEFKAAARKKGSQGV